MPEKKSPSTGDINAWAERLSDQFAEAATHLHNEMELREHVHQTILDAVKDLHGLDWTASAGERNTAQPGANRSALDRLYGGVAVEWEWDMGESRREHGADQALQYLHNLRANHRNAEAFTAVVADGKRWGFLNYDPDGQDDADLFSTEESPETKAGHFVWVENSPAACRQFLELVGAHKQSPITSRSLTQRFGPNSGIASRLVTVLGQSVTGRTNGDRTDTLYLEWRRVIDVVYGDLERTDSALAIEVQKTYKLPTAHALGESLFVLHTYFALVGRLLAVELLAVAIGERDDAPSSWRGLDDQALLDRLRGLERGDLPGDLEIANLFEADLFSWWADRAGSNTTLLNALRDLLTEMSNLAFPRIAFGPHQSGDVLRDLYQALVPNKLRKALGEFLTPRWLAESGLARLRDNGADLAQGRVLDPTSGTGTWLMPVLGARIRALKEAKGDEVTVEDVQDLLDSVTAIDLNPVAITATRVNYVLALGNLANIGALTLPVWRADSLIVPELSPHQATMGPLAGIVCSELETSLDAPFTIPVSLTTASQIAALRRVIEGALTPIADGNSDDVAVDAARAYFESLFDNEFGASGPHPLPPEFAYVDEKRVAVNLFGQVATLARAGRNGVWARLIENAYAPLFAGTFDVVVGNPPWLGYNKLPEGWRTKSEALWKRLGLWRIPEEQGDSYSVQTSDIAALVFGVSLMRYAKPDGFVALLVPKSLIIADPGNRAFRQFHLGPHRRDKDTHPGVDIRFRAVWLDDWSNVKPFAPDAANLPVFLITKKGEIQGASTPGAMWKRVPGIRLVKSSWHTARKALTEVTGTFSPVDPNTRTSAWSFQDETKPPLIQGGRNSYTFGKGLDTRGANGIYFVEVDRYRPAAGKDRAVVRVRNITSEGRNAAVEARGDVEADLVFPLLRGKDVAHWTARPVTYILLPHDPVELDQPVPQAELMSQYPKTFSWLSRNKTALQARQAPPTRAWDLQGDDWARVDGALQHMQTGSSVVVREFGDRPAAALATDHMDPALHRQVAPLIDHKLLLCTVPTRNEALYLVAVINSTPMQDLLESFVSATAVSPKSMKRLPIPDFDETNSDMTSLVSLADDVVKAHDPVARAAELQADMDTLVLRLANASPAYRPQPSKLARTRAKKTADRQSEDTPGLF